MPYSDPSTRRAWDRERKRRQRGADPVEAAIAAGRARFAVSEAVIAELTISGRATLDDGTVHAAHYRFLPLHGCATPPRRDYLVPPAGLPPTTARKLAAALRRWADMLDHGHDPFLASEEPEQ